MPALSRGLAASLLPFKLTRLLSVTSRGGRSCSSVAGDASSESDEDEVDALVGQKWDVVISGAGLAGAALACALGEIFEDYDTAALSNQNKRCSYYYYRRKRGDRTTFGHGTRLANLLQLAQCYR